MAPEDRFDQDVFNKSPIFAHMAHHRDKIKVTIHKIFQIGIINLINK